VRVGRALIIVIGGVRDIAVRRGALHGAFDGVAVEMRTVVSMPGNWLAKRKF